MVLKIQECHWETQVQKQEKNKRKIYLGMQKKEIFPESRKQQMTWGMQVLLS